MSRMLMLAIVAVLLIPVAALGQTSYDSVGISLDHVDGMVGGNKILAGEPIRFVLRLTYMPGDGSKIGASSNGFEIYEKNGGNFYPADPDSCAGFGWGAFYDLGFFIGGFSRDGQGADTVKFGGAAIVGGVPDGTDGNAFVVESGSDFDGDTLCIDSCFYPPGGSWLWSTNGPLGNYTPSWDGPHCFAVVECCFDLRGDIDMQDGINIGDLMYLVRYIFPPHAEVPCLEAANVDGLEGGGVPVNVGDITYLVAYLFQGGPPPPPCP